jgi:hypothetical protein
MQDRPACDLTTALNGQVVFLHPGKGVKTPPIATRPRRIITAGHYARRHASIPADTMWLLVETDVESGLRWGKQTELRVKDLDVTTEGGHCLPSDGRADNEEPPPTGIGSWSRTTPRTVSGVACSWPTTWRSTSATASPTTGFPTTSCCSPYPNPLGPGAIGSPTSFPIPKPWAGPNPTPRAAATGTAPPPPTASAPAAAGTATTPSPPTAPPDAPPARTTPAQLRAVVYPAGPRRTLGGCGPTGVSPA